MNIDKFKTVYLEEKIDKILEDIVHKIKNDGYYSKERITRHFISVMEVLIEEERKESEYKLELEKGGYLKDSTVVI